jgi:aminomethyltransferase
MPIGTAVHERTFALAESLNYREWSGYYAVSAYEAHHEHEYNAIRNASALIDVSPLFKYIISGRDALRLVDRIITRDATKLAVGQVYYTPWCDEHGKVIDDGTVARLDAATFRWTAADPSLRWFTQNAVGLDVRIEDVSDQVAALALQGPTSGRLLQAVADADIRSLKYFRMTRGSGCRGTARSTCGMRSWRAGARSTSTRPACSHSMSHASKPAFFSSRWISTAARRR